MRRGAARYLAAAVSACPAIESEVLVWMCSDKASFMTGASHVVDGGYYAA